MIKRAQKTIFFTLWTVVSSTSYRIVLLFGVLIGIFVGLEATWEGAECIKKHEPANMQKVWAIHLIKDD